VTESKSNKGLLKERALLLLSFPFLISFIASARFSPFSSLSHFSQAHPRSKSHTRRTRLSPFWPVSKDERENVRRRSVNCRLLKREELQKRRKLTLLSPLLFRDELANSSIEKRRRFFGSLFLRKQSGRSRPSQDGVVRKKEEKKKLPASLNCPRR